MKAEQKHYDAARKAAYGAMERVDLRAAVDAALALIPEPVVIDEGVAEKAWQAWCGRPLETGPQSMRRLFRAVFGESAVVAGYGNQGLALAEENASLRALLATEREAAQQEIAGLSERVAKAETVALGARERREAAEARVTELHGQRHTWIEERDAAQAELARLRERVEQASELLRDADKRDKAESLQGSSSDWRSTWRTAQGSLARNVLAKLSSPPALAAGEAGPRFQVTEALAEEVCRAVLSHLSGVVSWGGCVSGEQSRMKASVLAVLTKRAAGEAGPRFQVTESVLSVEITQELADRVYNAFRAVNSPSLREDMWHALRAVIGDRVPAKRAAGPVVSREELVEVADAAQAAYLAAMQGPATAPRVPWLHAARAAAAKLGVTLAEASAAGPGVSREELAEETERLKGLGLDGLDREEALRVDLSAAQSGREIAEQSAREWRAAAEKTEAELARLRTVAMPSAAEVRAMDIALECCDADKDDEQNDRLNPEDALHLAGYVERMRSALSGDDAAAAKLGVTLASAPAAEETAEDVFRAMAPSRRRANAAVLGARPQVGDVVSWTRAREDMETYHNAYYYRVDVGNGSEAKRGDDIADAAPEPSRPAVGAVVSWDVARADMEAYPEARWRPTGGTSSYRLSNGELQYKVPALLHWVESCLTETSGYSWTRLPDADAAPEPAAAKGETYDREAALRRAGFFPPYEKLTRRYADICEAIVDAKLAAKGTRDV